MVFNVMFLLFQIKLVNISGNDIVDGNQKLTLAVIWNIILHWQVGYEFKSSQID